MTTPADTAAIARPPTPYRRVLVATCNACDWQLRIRDYRSRRARNRKAIMLAGLRHAAETGHHEGTITIEHV